MRFWILVLALVVLAGIGAIVYGPEPAPRPVDAKRPSNFGISGSPALGKNPPQHSLPWWCPDPIEIERGAHPGRCEALDPRQGEP